jgi:hypothetical protein
MSERVTLEVSESVLQRAKEAAQRTGRPLEAVLADWLERGAAGEDVSPWLPRGAYPVFSPYGNEAAAQVLLDVLKAAEAEAHGTE